MRVHKKSARVHKIQLRVHNVLDDHQHIIKGIRPVSYLLKVASGEVRPRFKVGPLNEISNFVFGAFVVASTLKSCINPREGFKVGNVLWPGRVAQFDFHYLCVLGVSGTVYI